MTWYVASLRDQDTHLGEDITDEVVIASCKHSFHPLARFTGQPSDPLQVCPKCAESESQSRGAPRKRASSSRTLRPQPRRGIVSVREDHLRTDREQRTGRS